MKFYNYVKQSQNLRCNKILYKMLMNNNNNNNNKYNATHSKIKINL